MAGSLGADLWAGNWLGLAGGKPGWTVTWLGQDWLAGGQVARGRGLVGLEQRTGISLIGDLVTLWA